MRYPLQRQPVGKARRPAAAPPLAARTPDASRVRLCLPGAVALDLGEHLRFWSDTSEGRPSIESALEGRYELALMCWAAELLTTRAVLWLAPVALNRLTLPLSQAVMLYELLRTENHTSSLAPLRDGLHKLLV